MSHASSEEVLEFWLGDGREDRSELWFRGGSAVDDQCRDRFGRTWQAAVDGALDDWQASARGTLAWVVLIDQFSRNLHRGTALAFTHDPAAKEAAAALIRRGDDRQLTPFERVFLYLPFEHAENLADQDECVRLFSDLVHAFPQEQHERGLNFLAFAELHRDVVRRFGRFPHRNSVLGRATTAEEAAYLDGGGARFGQ